MGDREETATGDVQADDERLGQEYRTVADLVDGGVYRLDADGCFIAVTDAFVELTGYTREKLLGEHVSSLVDGQDGVYFDELRTRDESDANTTTETVIETASGDRRPCTVQASPLVADGEVDGAIGVVRPIEDGERRPDLPPATAVSESLATVIDEAAVGVVVIDDAEDVVWINETAEAYFGVDRRDVIGRDKQTVIEETIRNPLDEPDASTETVDPTDDDDTDADQFECRITPGPDREGRWLEHRSASLESGPYAGGRIDLYYDITDRKERELARVESNQRFESLVDAVEEYAIFLLDTEGHVVSWNEGAERIKGYDEAEIIGEHFSVFYTDEDRAADVPQQNLTRARETGVVEDEGWCLRADGSTFWADVTITAIRTDGELQGYAKVTQDLTDRRERERQLRHERNLVEQILETSPVGIAVVNPDGSTSRANRRMAQLLDIPAADASAYTAGQRAMFDTDGAFLPVEERPAFRVFETGEPLYDQELLLDPDGKRRWLSVNAAPITDEAGDSERVVVTATEITELRSLAERRKRELEEREKELATVRLATNLLETGEQPTNELLQEFVTKLPRSFRSPDRTAARVSVGEHEAATDSYEPSEQSITATATTANGTPVTIDIVRTTSQPETDTEPFLEDEQQLIETLATLVTFHFERQEYIDELRAETRRLEQFAYAASHDLQEPLRMVSSYLQLIERRYGDELDDDGREFLAFAVDGAERMRSMIEGLLEYSRVEAQGAPFEPVVLDAVLEDVLRDLEVRIIETNAEITTASLPTVEGDASQLRQLFQNLLENALEYSEGAPRVHVSAQRRGEKWVVSVCDDGIGIEPEETDRIFEVFQRLHSRETHDGTGIGLALCRRIVERHDGEIWVESDEGGSTFSMTLPAVSADEA